MGYRDHIREMHELNVLERGDGPETPAPKPSSVTPEAGIFRWRCTCGSNGLELTEYTADMAIEAHKRGHKSTAGWYERRHYT